MSRIDELIRELCPSGVEYLPLGSLGIRNKGTAITASRMRDLATVGGPIRIFAGGNTVADVCEGVLSEKAIVRVPSIVVKSRGYIGFSYYDRPFTHKSELWSYSLTDPRVCQKFVYFYLLTQVPQLQQLARSTSVKLPQLGVADTDKLLVPVPPLEVQREIVRILDEFTQLEAELEAELEKRRQQYEYYRDQLLSHNSVRNRVVQIGEIGRVVTGRTPRARDASAWGDALDFITPSDIRNGARLISVPARRLSQAYKQSSPTTLIPPRSILVTCIGADMGKTVINENECATNQQINAVVPSEGVDVGYMFHLLSSKRGQLLAQGEKGGGTMPIINKTDFSKIEVTLPPLDAQKSVADTLDKFDALVNDLSVGLPAELNARRKQYEYYRDQLLKFKELSA